MAPPPVRANNSDSDLCTVRTAGANPSTVQHRETNHLSNDAPPETRSEHESTRPFPLPYDIVEATIAHLAHDLCALKTCSLTCQSWYTAAVPHLHHTLTLTGDGPDTDRGRLKPLFKLHELGITHLVKVIRVRQELDTDWFVPQAFSQLELRHFSAFSNVQILKLENLEIGRFIPGLEHHFGQFSQTLRSITLDDPFCSPRQLSHFLSLFSNLDDISIRGTLDFIPTAPDTGLVPFSAPKLRGRLVLHRFKWDEVWTHLAKSGGLRFRHMDLRWSGGCAPALFEACAETLETLRFRLETGTPSKEFQMCSRTGLS